MSTRSITHLPPADFTPEMGNYRALQPFRYWCQKVLPLVYDDSLSYYELLCKVVDYLNKTMEDVETLHGDVTNLHTAYEQLQNYVNSYFSSLDVQEEINNKLDELVNNGTISGILNTMKYGNAIYIGNSYCEGVGSETNKGIYELTKNLFNKTWISQDGGTGFIPYTGHDNYFKNMLTYISNQLTITEKSSVNHIFFVSAIGDTRAIIENNYVIDKTLTEVNATVQTAKTLFPNAEICITFAESVVNGYGGTDPQAQLRFNNMLKENSSNIGYRYLGWIGWNTNHYIGFNSSDNYHPNDRGYRNLKNNFINSFVGSFEIVPKKITINIGNFGYMQVVYTDELLTLKLGNKDALNIISSETELFDFSNANVGIVPYSVYGNVLVTLFEPNYIPKQAYITVINGKIILTPFSEINTKNGYYCFDLIQIQLV